MKADFSENRTQKINLGWESSFYAFVSFLHKKSPLAYLRYIRFAVILYINRAPSNRNVNFVPADRVVKLPDTSTSNLNRSNLKSLYQREIVIYLKYPLVSRCLSVIVKTFDSKYIIRNILLFYSTGNMFSTYKRSSDLLGFYTINAAECELDLQKNESGAINSCYSKIFSPLHLPRSHSINYKP